MIFSRFARHFERKALHPFTRVASRAGLVVDHGGLADGVSQALRGRWWISGLSILANRPRRVYQIHCRRAHTSAVSRGVVCRERVASSSPLLPNVPRTPQHNGVAPRCLTPRKIQTET